MFKKVQLKLFAIITSILLALFIAVLVSINLIMEAVMQRQSKVVLKQIASSIEYDENTETFTYMPAPDDKKTPPEEHQPGGSENTQPSGDGSSASEQTAPETSGTEPDTSSEQSRTDASQSETSAASTDGSSESGSSDNSQSSTQTQITSATAGTEKVTTTQTTRPEQKFTQTSPNVPPEQQPQRTEPINPPEQDWENPPPFEHYPPPDDGEYYPDDLPEYDTDDGCYDFPPPDHRDYWYHEFYGGEYDEEYIEPESFTPDSDDTVYASQLSAAGIKPLEEYTVISGMPRTVFAADSAVSIKKTSSVPKTLGSIDFFVIMADKSGNYIASLNNDELDSSVAQKYISAILKDGASSGMLNSYQFCRLDKTNGTIMVFTDKSSEIDILDQLMHTTVLIGIISFVLLSVLALFLSKKSIQPIKVAFEKQKQFVSDASHELKTPLTIISANADVLADEIGQNKWLTYIKAQTERMNVLVNDLLNLTRLENNTTDFICSDFDLSKAIENTALPFECQAFEDNKVFEINIQDGLTLNGSERHVKQMAAIFIDNALKYSNAGGTVRITLKAQGDKKILSVFNTGKGIRNDEKDKIFERFYRSDDSRARTTGGYGLGLAIAKSIIDKHKFKISVDNVEGKSICFNVIM